MTNTDSTLHRARGGTTYNLHSIFSASESFNTKCSNNRDRRDCSSVLAGSAVFFFTFLYSVLAPNWDCRYLAGRALLRVRQTPLFTMFWREIGTVYIWREGLFWRGGGAKHLCLQCFGAKMLL